MSRQFYTRKCDEAQQRAMAATKRIIDACMTEPKDDDDDCDVAAFLGESIFKGVLDALMDYYPVDAYQPDVSEAIRFFDKLRESKKSNSPSLREAQSRIAAITGKRSLKEGTGYERMISHLADKVADKLADIEIEIDPTTGVDEDTYEMAAQIAQDVLGEYNGDPNMFQDVLDELGIFVN